MIMTLAQVGYSQLVISRSEATRDLVLKSEISPHFVRRNDGHTMISILTCAKDIIMDDSITCDNDKDAWAEKFAEN